MSSAVWGSDCSYDITNTRKSSHTRIQQDLSRLRGIQRQLISYLLSLYIPLRKQFFEHCSRVGGPSFLLATDGRRQPTIWNTFIVTALMYKVDIMFSSFSSGATFAPKTSCTGQGPMASTIMLYFSKRWPPFHLSAILTHRSSGNSRTSHIEHGYVVMRLYLGTKLIIIAG